MRRRGPPRLRPGPPARDSARMRAREAAVENGSRSRGMNTFWRLCGRALLENVCGAGMCAMLECVRCWNVCDAVSALRGLVGTRRCAGPFTAGPIEDSRRLEALAVGIAFARGLYREQRRRAQTAVAPRRGTRRRRLSGRAVASPHKGGPLFTCGHPPAGRNRSRASARLTGPAQPAIPAHRLGESTYRRPPTRREHVPTPADSERARTDDGTTPTDSERARTNPRRLGESTD